ncbi:MAG: glycoside hydrolase [Brucellaceae bacterium]|nr:glycoside hydrolase [Brucellaceae bacterium]
MDPLTTIPVSIFGAGLLAFALLAVLRRVLPATFLAAGTNSRSNHVLPARQIGGLAAIPAALIAATAAGAAPALPLAAALLLLWLSGLADDWRPHGAAVRLALQFLAAFLALAAMPGPNFVPDFLPDPVAYALASIFLVWCMNMVNFMDGLDLMTASGAGIPLAFPGIVLAIGGSGSGFLACAMAGGLAGFAVHNRPPAKVFLGDNGSLPLGLVAGIAMLSLAGKVGPLAALAPFAYYFWDSGITLVQRLSRKENIFASHSSHAYQRAFRAGMPAMRIAALVATASVLSGLMVIAAAMAPSPITQAVAGLAGLACGFLAWWRLDNAARKSGKAG